MIYNIPKNAIIQKLNDDFNIIKDGISMMGLNITTNKGDIIILISDSQCCCEDFDALFLETPDNLNKFIGAKILKIEDVCVTSACGNKLECDEVQLKISTNKGILQYAVYNSHNGFYSHATFFQVFDTIEKSLI